jgi:hypothetical protein
VVLPTLLLFAQTGLVAVVPDASPGCPSAKDIEEALYARVPRAMIPFTEAKRRGALQLTLTPATPEGGRTFTLVDIDGRTRLKRPLAAGAEQKDCTALAETASLIVQRFLTTLDDPVIESPLPVPRLELSSPVPERPDRRWDLSISSGWRVGTQGWEALTAGARVGRLLGRSGQFLIVAGAGLGNSEALLPAGMSFRGTAQVRQVPIELGLWWRRREGKIELQAGAGSGLDLTHVRASSESGNNETRLLPGPLLFFAGALRMVLHPPTFLRLSTMLAGNLVTYRFTHGAQSTQTTAQTARMDSLTVFAVPTRRIYGRIAVDVGLSLP